MKPKHRMKDGDPGPTTAHVETMGFLANSLSMSGSWVLWPPRTAYVILSVLPETPCSSLN